MRSVNKGAAPARYAEYGHARVDLYKRLGMYCSFCERVAETGLDVEHVFAKKLHPDLILDWDNFLLACRHCNSNKGAQDVAQSVYVWPDEHDTFRLFNYHANGFISATTGHVDSPAALNTLALLELNRFEPLKYRTDLRFKQRVDAWQVAERSHANLSKHESESMRHQIVLTAQSRGYFSIWMTVFKDDADMQSRLADAFPGTRWECS